MASAQSVTISSLIRELSAIEEKSNGSVFENEDLRASAAHLTRKLAVVLDKPQEVVLMNASLPAQVAAVRIAVDLHLFEFLSDGPETKSIFVLASQTGADAEFLIRILRLLSAMGWVDQTDDVSFKPTPITDVLNKSEPIRAGIKHMYHALPIYEKLPEYFAKSNYKSPVDVRNGPFQYAYGVNETAFEYWAKSPTDTKLFNTFMTGVRGSRPHWVDWFPVQERFIDGSSGKDEDVLLVDVGGGKGHDLNKFIATFPDAKGRYVLEDLPVVIDDTYDRNSRIEARKHDFFQEQPIQGARMYFMHHVLHDWPDDDVVRILTQIARAMKPGYSRLLLGENVLQDVDCHLYPALLDWGMMVLHCGMTRTVGRWRALCEKSGLKLVKYWPPPGDGDGVLEAELQ